MKDVKPSNVERDIQPVDAGNEIEDIVTRLRRTRATMLGTDDEQHYVDCHEAADEIVKLRAALRVLRERQ